MYLSPFLIVPVTFFVVVFYSWTIFDEKTIILILI